MKHLLKTIKFFLTPRVEYNGKVYTLKEANNMIPAHPNCGCAWAPVVELPK